MTNPSHPKQRCFMKDFAALDLRSTHAHLRGQSWRPKAYAFFEGVSRLLGRGQQAADDYRYLSRWLYRHREPLARCIAQTSRISTALLGMAAGIALYLAILT